MKSTIHTIAIALIALVLSSCIDETFPAGDTVTAEQIASSATALHASVRGIPSQMVQGYYLYGYQNAEIDMAYPQFMIEATELLGDMYPYLDPGFDHYFSFNTTSGNFNESTDEAYVPWATLYKFVKAANDILAVIDFSDDLSAETRGYAGIAYACRAFYYYLLTVFYEPAENIYTDVSAVAGLTVPIVTETTTNAEAINNPRVPHDEMIAFILSDLDKAEEYLADYTPESQLFPSLSVVYGIKAKVYLWDENYALAAQYARKAIDSYDGTPMTEAQWLDTNSAFNTANQAWMWYLHYDAENLGSNLPNLIGWLNYESTWSYATYTGPVIDRRLYESIPETDFRKYAFIDPDKDNFYPYVCVQGDDFLADAPAYTALKFRCCEGDYASYITGATSDVPVMRVEEMYYIEAEALAMSEGLAQGIQALTTFETTYRNPSYVCSATTTRDFQLELLTKMRVEFWGEGNAFPSAKRLRPGVMQNYDGTNAPSDALKLNCQDIKPTWNYIIPIAERQQNHAIEGYNNPNPSGCLALPSPVNEYSLP